MQRRRRTDIGLASGADINIEDLISRRACGRHHQPPTSSVRRSPSSARRGRGERGSKGSTTRDQDFLEDLFVATNHNYLLIFTQKGRAAWMRVFDIPEGTRQSKGRHPEPGAAGCRRQGGGSPERVRPEGPGLPERPLRDAVHRRRASSRRPRWRPTAARVPTASSP